MLKTPPCFYSQHLIYYFCKSCPLFVFSALCDLPREAKLFENNFRKTFYTNFSFLKFSVKEIIFPSLGRDLFVTFDTLDLMSFLDDCGKCLSSFLFLGHSQVFFLRGKLQKHFPFEGLPIFNDFAWSFLNIKNFTKKVEKEFYVSNTFFENCAQKLA